MDFADDPEFQALIREFASQFPARRDEVLAAMERKDFQSVAESAHKLAGCAAAYGFDELGQTARQCEQTIVAGGDEQACRDRGRALAALLHDATPGSQAA
jgi:HPt (histidine-containing phosphotransfer) domain-containing protein